jgi:RND family efflux transporter MFP subunit
VDYIKRNIPWAIAVLLLVVGAIWVQNRPPKVEVVQAKVEQLAEILAVSGQVRGREESRLAPETNGTVGELLVEEGELVRAGRPLARLKMDRLQAQYDQALQRVGVASAQLDVASRGPLDSEFQEVRSEVQRSEKVATAALESARQRLLEAQRGPRREQIQQAEAELTQITANAEQSVRDAKRQVELFQRGAVSKQAYETALTASKQAAAAQEKARERLAELQNGTRPEQLAQARQSVLSSEADLQAAHRTGQARIQQLLDRPRAEDIALARAQLEEARAALELAQEQRDQAVVTAPYDGMVGRRLLRVGDPAGPGAPIFTFASQPSLEIRVEIDESERARVKDGQTAMVRANGYPDSFEATVRDTAAEIDSLTGTLEVRLSPKESPEWLLPGQTVDVNLILSPQGERLLIPLTSVILNGENSHALVLADNKLEERSIQVSSPSQDGYLVLSGIEKGEWVVRYPQGLKAGQAVRPDRTSP